MIKPKQFNLVICTLFSVLFVLFGSMGFLLFLSSDVLFENLPFFVGAILSVFMYGLMAAWGFGGLVGGIWIGCAFINRRGKRAIIIACVFFIFTLQIFWIIGLVATIPIVVYNCIKIRRGEGERPTFAENTPLTVGEANIIKTGLLVVFVGLFTVTIHWVVVTINERGTDNFFLTPQEAFVNSRFTEGDMGEIIFYDAHENNVTLLTVRNGFFFATFFQTEKREGVTWYRHISTGNGPNLSHGITTSQFFLHAHLTEGGLVGRNNRNHRETFGRREVFGIYPNEAVRTLSINGIPVEHVFEFTNPQGEPYFIWYFSNLPPFTGSWEEIEIRFGDLYLDEN